MEYRSFDDWKQLGYVVVKGEKSSAKTHNGTHLFSCEQVKRAFTASGSGIYVTKNSGDDGFKGHYHSEEYENAMYP